MKTNVLPSLVLAALLLAAPSASAQEGDHDAHHPEGGELPEAPGMTPEGTTGPGMMGEGMMGSGMMTPEMMEMMTPEMMQMMMRMMGQGMMRPGMPGQGAMGQGAMGEQGMPDAMPRQGMGPGMMGQMRMGMPGGDPLLYGSPHLTPEPMTPERVRELLQQRLDYHGNPRLTLGEIAEADDGSITAEIVTVDGALVQKLAFNRYPGLVRQLTE